MALSCLHARGVRWHGLRTRGPARCVIRAQAGPSSTTVQFKLHRHVEFGQSLLLVGSLPELGSWDVKSGLELNWSDGDNWSASMDLPAGSAVEYKYIVKRKEGFDWCPGQNKAFTLPSAEGVLVTDTWDHPHGCITPLVLEDVAALSAEGSAVPSTAEAEGPAVHEVASAAETNGIPAEAPLNTGSSAAQELVTAVNTVENLHVPELESGAPTPSLAAQHQQPPGFLANNIVQAVPLGAIAVGQDPITQYEEADKYQVVEVGSTERIGSTVAAEARGTTSATINGKQLDKMTMAELRTEVKRRGMSPLGNRRELVTRLREAGIV